MNMCVTHTRVFGMCAFCVRAAHESQAVCQLSPYSLSTYRFETGSLTEPGLGFQGTGWPVTSLALPLPTPRCWSHRSLVDICMKKCCLYDRF